MFVRKNGNIRFGAIIATVVIVLTLLITAFGSFTTIPSGYTGVRTTFGQIDERPVPQGFNWKIPFVQHIELVNNKQQDLTFKDKVWAETSERTAIYYEGITVTYKIDPTKSAWIFANVSDYRNALVSNEIVASAIKAASKNFNDVDATNRSLICPKAIEMLQAELNRKYGEQIVTINQITISNADFDTAYNNAIAARQQAVLEAQRQAVENDRAVAKAAADAEVRKAEATADAEAKRIAAEAQADVQRISAEADANARIVAANAEAESIRVKGDAEAEANQKMGASLTPELLQMLMYEAWQNGGNVPQTYVGTDVFTSIFPFAK